MTLLTADDLYLFNEGSHFRLWEKLGAHITPEGTAFAVWAPDATGVYVMGEFNGWNRESHPLKAQGQSGIWSGTIPGVGKGTIYKYRVLSRFDGHEGEKADPYGFYHEVPPQTASCVWDLEYEWGDAEWMRVRRDRNAADAPMSVYEVHLGSWMRGEDNRMLNYREMGDRLADYAAEMGFSHVELMPVMEHPFYGSWGYQLTGYFAPSSRFGSPQDFMYLVDRLHQRGVGVILDWVPSHFATDAHGLAFFDGTHLYEHQDLRQGFHPDWGSLIFNYSRNEIRNFLISNALFWLDVYHADGLRVDAVASMLYLDYSRKAGEWIPNEHGGRENLGAIQVLRKFNEEVYRVHPEVQTIAEESTAWPMVSRPTYVGGLGFGMKWDMGWMHDMLSFMQQDPVFRKYHYGSLTFRMLYAFNENFVMPLSHDEVVHGKGSLLNKMPGDWWQKFANLRLLYSWMYTQPGKKLLFMGGEFGQWAEWNHDQSLDWHLLDLPTHAGIRHLVGDLNRLYKFEPALHGLDFDPSGFQWIDCSDWEASIASFMRQGRSPDDQVIAAFNFTPVPRPNYQLGAPVGGFWREIFNSDAEQYGGSGQGNMGGVESAPFPLHGRPHMLTVTLPPLGAVFFKRA